MSYFYEAFTAYLGAVAGYFAVVGGLVVLWFVLINPIITLADDFIMRRGIFKWRQRK